MRCTWKTLWISLAVAAVAPMVPIQALAIPSDNPSSGNQEAIAEGRLLYLTHCYGCHGQRLNGRTRFPAADLTVYKRGYAAYVITVKYGRSGKIGRMPGWRRILNDHEIEVIGTYVEAFAKPEAVWTNPKK